MFLFLFLHQKLVPYAYGICVLFPPLIFTNCRVYLRREIHFYYHQECDGVLSLKNICPTVSLAYYLHYSGRLCTDLQLFVLWMYFLFLEKQKADSRYEELSQFDPIFSHFSEIQIFIFLNIHLNAILPSMPRIPTIFFPLRHSNRKLFSKPQHFYVLYKHSKNKRIGRMIILDRWLLLCLPFDVLPGEKSYWNKLSQIFSKFH